MRVQILKSCGEKGGGGFLYSNLEREPHLDLEDEADFMDSMRREERLEDFYKRITLSVIYFCNETIKNTFDNFKKIKKFQKTFNLQLILRIQGETTDDFFVKKTI